MRKYFEMSIKNITKHGDTDIFPFPIENHIFFDKTTDIVDQLTDIDRHFAQRLVQFPPSNEGALAPVNYVGFRWATQLDPLLSGSKSSCNSISVADLGGALCGRRRTHPLRPGQAALPE